MTSTIKKVVFDDVPNIDKHKSSATFPESEIEVVDLEPPKHNDSLIYVDIVNGYLNIPYITTDSIKDLLQRLISEKKTELYTTPVLKNGTIDIKLFNCDVDYNVTILNITIQKKFQ